MFSNEELIYLNSILEDKPLTDEGKKLKEKIEIIIEFNKLNEEFNSKKSVLSEKLDKLISGK